MEVDAIVRVRKREIYRYTFTNFQLKQHSAPPLKLTNPSKKPIIPIQKVVQE
jgi:hypothetical protein